MSEFPSSVLRASGIVGQGSYEFLYRFKDTWGGFDLPALMRALEKGQSEERLFALLAIGCGMYTSAIPTVIPVLQSEYPLERWAAALSLGIMKEETALSALVTQVTEFLPNPQYYSIEESLLGWSAIEWRYDEWRSTTIRFLEEWERPDLGDAYLRMAKAFWFYDQEKNDQVPLSVRKMQKHNWKQCLKELLYALGRLGKFEEVVTLGREMNVPDPILSLWMVYCAFGFLHIRTRYPDADIFKNLNRKWDDQALQKEIADILEQQFSLSNEEARVCLERYLEEVETFFEVRGWEPDEEESEEKSSEVDDTFGGIISPF